MSEFGMIFMRSAGVGVAVAAPVGPMSLLCMRRCLTQGWRHGLATGGGIAMADGMYASVAALGLASVSAFLLAHQGPLHGIAAIFLIWLGVRTIFSRAEGAAAAREASPAACFAGSVLLTLANPPTIVLFAAFFTALAPASGFDLGAAEATVSGVVCGSLAWWCGLVAVLAALRHAIPARVRAWIGRVAGAALCLFGLDQLRRVFHT